ADGDHVSHTGIVVEPQGSRRATRARESGWPILFAHQCGGPPGRAGASRQRARPKPDFDFQRLTTGAGERGWNCAARDHDARDNECCRKYAIVIPDGAADEPQESLGGMTPLEAARTPNMDRVATMGVVARACQTPKALPAGSEIGNLSLLGYNPFENFTGRA